MLNIDRPEWHANAACLGEDVEVFFPHRGEDVSEAKRICEGCPVRTECLAFALDTGQHFGVWGGTSERQRRRMRHRAWRQFTDHAEGGDAA